MAASTPLNNHRPVDDTQQAMALVVEDAAMQCRRIVQDLQFPWFHLQLRSVAPPGYPVQIVADEAPTGLGEALCDPARPACVELARNALGAIVPLDLFETIERGAAADRAGLAADLRALGVTDGVIIALHGPRTSHCALTLMHRQRLPRAGLEREALLRRAHWLALPMFDHVLDAIGRAYRRNRRLQPTSRQRSALALAAQGKPLADIAVELDVHQSTARYLVTRATEKLGAASRTDAIVRAAAVNDFAHGPFAGLFGSVGVFQHSLMVPLPIDD